MSALPRRVLVTGGTGFVGQHLLPLLRDRLPHAVVQAAAMDLSDPATIWTEVESFHPDACIHLAAIAAVPTAQQAPDAAWKVNLHGTLSLARALLTVVPDCILLFASTADAYGRSFAPGLPVTEAFALAPVNTYSATKAAADLALGALVGDGLRVIRVRPFNHTGPGQSAQFVVSAFARQVVRIAAGLQPPVMQVGALDPRRDFLDVRDVCAAYADCLLAQDSLPPGTILNLSSGTSRAVGDVLAELLDIAGVRAAVETDRSRLRATDIPLAYGDAALARDMLGWRPRIAWHVTLSDLLVDWRVRAKAEVAAA